MSSLLLHAQDNKVESFKDRISTLIYEIDSKLSELTSEIIQNPSFKQLESTWRSLELLVDSNNQPSKNVKVKIIDFNWDEISRNVYYASDIKSTKLYKEIYAKELNTSGGHPFGLVIVDQKISPFETDQEYDDIYTLQLLSELAEFSLCPFLFGLKDDFFGIESHEMLHDHKKVKRILDSQDYSMWNLLRTKSASRFIYVVINDYLQRYQYTHHNAGFSFSEMSNRDCELWGNSAYLLALNVIKEYQRISWFGFLRAYTGTNTDGAICQLDTNVVTKANLFAENDGFWSQLGLIPLCSLYLSDHKGFFSNQSVWKPTNDDVIALGSLQTCLMSCRFGHYIKSLTREQIGSFNSVADSKKSLESWLNKYTNSSSTSKSDSLVHYPLKSASVQISKSKLDETKYHCSITLQPQYQYDLVDVEIVLNTDMSESDVMGA